jgi:septal ring factor EnvC (AmiA/AmiB activator)
MSASKAHIFFIILLLFISPYLYGQKSKSQLENEKRQNQQKIEEAQKILKETEESKKSSVGQLRALNREIEARKLLIQSINSEIKYLNDDIVELNLIIEAMEQDLTQLKKEYAAMIYSASKASGSIDRLTFLFSAKTFNQLLMRLKYMEQYADARKTQVEQSMSVKDEITRQKELIESKKDEQKILLSENVRENNRLNSLKSKQSKVLVALGKKEKEIRKDLEERKLANERLDKLIADLIEKEIKANATASTRYEMTPEAKLLSASFSDNRSKLFWPVEKGFISQKYGRQPHPTIPGVQVDNPGVDIQTSRGETVRAVFDGKVSAVASIKGMPGVVVIIQHGEYRTVYANLKNANVKSGESVKAKDQIGTVYTDKDGLSEVQFQVWKGSQRMNPQTWLYTN